MRSEQVKVGRASWITCRCVKEKEGEGERIDEY